jgi:hypothetical protein
LSNGPLFTKSSPVLERYSFRVAAVETLVGGDTVFLKEHANGDGTFGLTL